MHVQEMALDDLVPLEKNPRLHPERQLQEMERSLQAFGQYRPLVIDARNQEILAGNGLFLVMQRLGWAKASVLSMENLSAADRSKLILADNKLAELGGTDFTVVDEILRDLEGDYDIPGFDSSVLEDLMATPQEAELAAGEYGIIPEETLENMQRNSERIQESHEGATVGTPPPPMPVSPPISVPSEAKEQAEAAGEPDICPTCKRPW